jgi:tyrosinase
MEIAGRLIQIFMDQPNVKTLMSVALYCKDRINPYLFNYALAVAINHRQDTQNENTPSIVEMFPEQFIEPGAFPRLREEGKLPESTRV